MDNSCNWCNGDLGDFKDFHPSCQTAHDAKCAENEARLADRSRPGWPFESVAAKRAWADDHFNSVEYYERRKNEIARRGPFMEQYPTKESFLNRERPPVDYSQMSELEREAFQDLTPESRTILESWSYDSMKESYEHDVRFVAEYEAGIRSRWTDEGIEYYTPDGTVVRTYRKGDKDKK